MDQTHAMSVTLSPGAAARKPFCHAYGAGWDPFRFGRRFSDFMWSRQPKFIPTAITLVLVALLLALGTWQLFRLHEKNDLLAGIRHHLAQPPVDLRFDWPEKNARQTEMQWRDMHYRLLVLQGRWLGAPLFKLAPRTYEGEAGYQLIAPLRLDDGQIVLVDRGFVPEAGEAATQMEDVSRVTVIGIGRVMERKKPFMGIPNDPARNQWVWPDVKAMGDETGFPRTADILVYEARDPKRDSYPIGGQLPLPQSNSHWHYAATWYALALILTGVYIMSLSPKQSAIKTDDQDKTADNLDPVASRDKYPEATD